MRTDSGQRIMGTSLPDSGQRIMGTSLPDSGQRIMGTDYGNFFTGYKSVAQIRWPLSRPAKSSKSYNLFGAVIWR